MLYNLIKIVLLFLILIAALQDNIEGAVDYEIVLLTLLFFLFMPAFWVWKILAIISFLCMFFVQNQYFGEIDLFYLTILLATSHYKIVMLLICLIFILLYRAKQAPLLPALLIGYTISKMI